MALDSSAELPGTSVGNLIDDTADLTGYSRTNAERFGWSSVSGDLNPERVAHLEKHLTGQTVLDAGCGGGAFVDFLSRRGLDVTGVDLHPEFLSIGKEREYRGRFVQGDVTALPFADKSFDFTFCFDVLEHVDDQAAVRELARVTRQRLLIAVPRKNEEFAQYNLTFLHYSDTTHLRYYDEDVLARLAQSVEPRQVQVYPELFVSVGEMVRDLTRIDRDALHARVAALLADIPPAVRGIGDDTSARDQAIDSVVPPPFPTQGVRDRLRAWGVQDPHVRQHFKEAYRPAANEVVRHYTAGAAQRVESKIAAAVNSIAGQVADAILFEAVYPSIPTGLVAVIDF